MADAGQAPDTANWHPEFAKRLTAFRDALTKAGIESSISSGYRTPEYQNQMYQNHLAKKIKQPLPFPNVEAPDVVAPPWRSFHNFGIAADLHLSNPNDYARMAQMAQQFGLSGIGPSDPGHIQLAGTLDQDIKQYQLAGWRPETRPAPASGAIAYGGPAGGVQVASAGAAPIGVKINSASAPIAGGLAKPAGGGFLTSVANIESNDSNVPSKSDKDYPGQPGSKSQGHWQIDTPTWQQFGAKAGIDLSQYPNAMSAPRNIQEQVARLIPLSRFGGRTVRMLNTQYKTTLDKSLTLGTLDAKYGGGAPGAEAATSSTGDAAPTTTATAAAAPADQTLWQKITSPQTDAQGNPVAGAKSPLQQMAEGLGGKDKGSSLQQFKQAQEDEAPQGTVRNQAGQAPGSRNTSPMGGALLPSVPQTYGQTLNSFSTPLTWNSAPPRAPQMAPAGLQGVPGGGVPGVSLNSFQPEGIGYGLPAVGYGYG